MQQQFQAALNLSFAGGQQRVPVMMTAVPNAWQVQAGWGLTIGALLLEGSTLAAAVLLVLLLVT